MIALFSTARPESEGQSLCGTLPDNPAIVLRNAVSAVTTRFFPAAKASGQHPAAMTLADAHPAHREVAAGRAISLKCSASAKAGPPSLEAVLHPLTSQGILPDPDVLDISPPERGHKLGPTLSSRASSTSRRQFRT